jgi:hypothetical protein
MLLTHRLNTLTSLVIILVTAVGSTLLVLHAISITPLDDSTAAMLASLP